MDRVLLFTLFVAAVHGEIFFQETFSDGDAWTDRWVKSNWKQDTEEAGDLKLDCGEWYGDEEKDLGIKTSDDARFYAYSTKFDKPVSNADGGDLVFQFSVKHTQNLDCGGGYLKLFTDQLDPENMDGDSEYRIMFGPDICGTSTKRIHVIFNHDGNNLLLNKDIRAENDDFTHVYTLIVHDDSTYDVRVDGESKQTGSLYDDWDFEEPKEIDDPEASKPDDWVDDPYMDDPEDIKPEGWDDIPEQIVDPEAEKPEDWEDEFDGEWEAPTIDNPDFKGPWAAKRVENPDYTGPWEHPRIPNPDYSHIENVGKYTDIGGVGIEVWQVTSGSIFDNILVTDSVEEAEKFLEETYTQSIEREKELYEEIQEAKRDAQKAEAEAAEAARKEAENDDDGDDDQDDEEGELDEDDDDEDEGDDADEAAEADDDTEPEAAEGDDDTEPEAPEGDDDSEPEAEENKDHDEL